MAAQPESSSSAAGATLTSPPVLAPTLLQDHGAAAQENNINSSKQVSKILDSIPEKEPEKQYNIPGTKQEKDFFPKNFHPRRCFSQEDTARYRCKDSNFPSAWAEYQVGEFFRLKKPRQEQEILYWYKKTDVLRVKLPAHVFHLPARVADDVKPTTTERLKNEKKIQDLKRVLYSMNRAHQSQIGSSAKRSMSMTSTASMAASTAPSTSHGKVMTGAATPMMTTGESFYNKNKSVPSTSPNSTQLQNAGSPPTFLPKIMFDQAVQNSTLNPADFPLSSPGREQAPFMELETVEVPERLREEKIPNVAEVSGPQYARNCISMGIHHDNIKDYRKAIPYYDKFLKLCMRARDKQGIAMAYHCMAIDYQLCALEENITEQQRQSDFENAIRMHVKHRNHADLVGRFVSHVNLGICFGHLNDREASTLNHQVAFQLAQYLHSKDAKRLSARNIAFDAQLLNGPLTSGTVRARFQLLVHVLQEHYSNVGQSVTDVAPGPEKQKPKHMRKHGGFCPQNHRHLRASQALKQIGDLHKDTNNYENAIVFYDKALTLASRSGEQQEKKNTLTVQLALTKAKSFGEEKFVEKMLVNAEKKALLLKQLEQEAELDSKMRATTTGSVGLGGTSRNYSSAAAPRTSAISGRHKSTIETAAEAFDDVDPTDMGALILNLNTGGKRK